MDVKSRTVVLLVMGWKRTGGLEAVTMDIAWAFQSLGWRVKVIAVFDTVDAAASPGVEVVGLCPRGRLQQSVWRRFLWTHVVAMHVRRALADGGILLCAHAHLLPALERVAKRPDVRRWAWVYGLDVWGGEALRWAPFLNRLDRVVSISAFTAGEIVRAGFTKPLSIVPCCVDVGMYTPTTTMDRIRRNEILICGRMAANERYKGHEVLFQALPVAERILGRALTIHVVGAGDDQARLREFAVQQGVADRVTFAGRVSAEALVEAYRHCGVFCMPSRVERPGQGYWSGEGFGIVYIEAASCGRPVIASADGGAPETIIPEETGLMVDPRSPDAVGQAIAEVLADAVRADEMGRRGRVLVETRFSRERFRANLQELVALEGSR